MPFSYFSLNSYLDLFVLAVNCGQDTEGRLEINAEKDLVELFVQSVPKSTKEKAVWAFRLYERWALWGRGVYNPGKETSIVGGILLVYSDLDTMPEEDLNEVLSQFIGEVRKQDGTRCPGKTLHELISSSQKYFASNGRKVNFFSTEFFEKLRKSLEVKMKLLLGITWV